MSDIIALQSLSQSTSTIITDAEPTSPGTTSPNPLQFYIISICYLIFTITDSSLRMIILFELYTKRYDVIAIAVMFCWYEAVGIFTNLIGGVLGSSRGLRFGLLVGLLSQLLGIGLLTVLVASDSWNRYSVISFATFAMSFTGIAKDMVKLAGKSSTKLVKVLKSSYGDDGLFKLVAWLTGAKNSVKGFGFFLGGMLIQYAGYWQSLLVLFVMILPLVLTAYIYLDSDLGVSKTAPPRTLKEIFKKDDAVYSISLARFFLFGSRDVWFEVVLPVFLRSMYGWPYIFAGTVLALWVIFYGIIQSATPTLILQKLGQYPIKSGKILVPWSIILGFVCVFLSLFMTLYTVGDNVQKSIFLIGIFIFGFIFAINSSIHSFLIVAYSSKDKIAQTVGFYYMANAGGRLFGTLLSGFLYNYLGISACLWASFVMAIITSILSTRLHEIGK